MTDGPIPDDVRDFILRYIDSVGQLEALLLLRHSPSERWDAARTASRLYSNEQEVKEALIQLCNDGLLRCKDEVYWYECQNPELRGMVDRLAEHYSRHLIPVTNLIHAKPRRIREFANAFRLRRDR